VDVEVVRESVLRDLYSADSVLGKAVQLWLVLHAMCAAPSATVSVKDALEGDRASLARLLADLASKLPANAAHTVMNSLSLWQVQAPATKGDDAAAAQLMSQGFVWYSILAGEAAAKDLLRVSDYVGTADELAVRLRPLAWQAMHHKAPWVLAGVILLLLGAGVACWCSRTARRARQGVSRR
jgi:hypothetical protein